MTFVLETPSNNDEGHTSNPRQDATSRMSRVLTAGRMESSKVSKTRCEASSQEARRHAPHISRLSTYLRDTLICSQQNLKFCAKKN